MLLRKGVVKRERRSRLGSVASVAATWWRAFRRSRRAAADRRRSRRQGRRLAKTVKAERLQRQNEWLRSELEIMRQRLDEQDLRARQAEEAVQVLEGVVERLEAWRASELEWQKARSAMFAALRVQSVNRVAQATGAQEDDLLLP